MWLVNILIPSDKFFDVMAEMSGWVDDEQLECSSFTCARDRAGDVRLCVRLSTAADADRLAARFGGQVLASPDAASLNRTEAGLSREPHGWP